MRRPDGARRPDDPRLFERYRRDGDRAARDALVERYLPLAHHLARRYHGRDGHGDDIAQVASIGLLKAIERFDPARGTAFSSFAVPTILGEIKRYFRDKGWAVRVPRALQELALGVERVSAQLELELGRSPSAAQVAHRLGASIEDVLEARVASWAHFGVSLDRPAAGDDDNRTLGDSLGVTDAGFGQAEDAVMFDSLVSGLTDRQRLVLNLRFRDDLTQREIATRIGVSQMHVSRIVREAVDEIRAGLEG